jgi:hypothetical protein
LRDILPVFARNYENSPKKAQNLPHRWFAEKLRNAISIPVGTAKKQQKKRLKMAFFLLFLGNFRVKQG